MWIFNISGLALLLSFSREFICNLIFFSTVPHAHPPMKDEEQTEHVRAGMSEWVSNE